MKNFGGFDCGISPFVRTLQGQRFKKSGVKDLEPENNKQLPVYPQILTNQTDDFINLAKVLFDMGYPKINLNMGCPVPTASGKGRGAGLLPEIDYVDRMLDQVLKEIPNQLSIKTRIGLEAEDDLIKMSTVFNRYPLFEVIIHPRTAKQKYGGKVNHTVFDEACRQLNHDVVYSGDIFTLSEFKRIQLMHPDIKKWMLGRGILRDPSLMAKIRGEEVSLDIVPKFLLELTDLYRKRDLSEHIILSRIKTLMVYLGAGQDYPKKKIKALRKSKDVSSLIQALDLG